MDQDIERAAKDVADAFVEMTKRMGRRRIVRPTILKGRAILMSRSPVDLPPRIVGVWALAALELARGSGADESVRTMNASEVVATLMQARRDGDDPVEVLAKADRGRRKDREFHLTAALYLIEGTLEAASKHGGFTRERVRQILKMAQAQGSYQHVQDEDPTADEVQPIFDGRMTFAEARRHLRLELVVAERVLAGHGMDRNHFAQIARERGRRLVELRRARTLEEYDALVAELGFHPSTVDLQTTNERRATYTNILRDYGTIADFREERGIREESRMREDRKRVQGLRPTTTGVCDIVKRIMVERDMDEIGVEHHEVLDEAARRMAEAHPTWKALRRAVARNVLVNSIGNNTGKFERIKQTNEVGRRFRLKP